MKPLKPSLKKTPSEIQFEITGLTEEERLFIDETRKVEEAIARQAYRKSIGLKFERIDNSRILDFLQTESPLINEMVEKSLNIGTTKDKKIDEVIPHEVLKSALVYKERVLLENIKRYQKKTLPRNYDISHNHIRIKEHTFKDNITTVYSGANIRFSHTKAVLKFPYIFDFDYQLPFLITAPAFDNLESLFREFMGKDYSRNIGGDIELPYRTDKAMLGEYEVKPTKRTVTHLPNIIKIDDIYNRVATQYNLPYDVIKLVVFTVWGGVRAVIDNDAGHKIQLTHFGNFDLSKPKIVTLFKKAYTAYKSSKIGKSKYKSIINFLWRVRENNKAAPRYAKYDKTEYRNRFIDNVFKNKTGYNLAQFLKLDKVDRESLLASTFQDITSISIDRCIHKTYQKINGVKFSARLINIESLALKKTLQTYYTIHLGPYNVRTRTLFTNSLYYGHYYTNASLIELIGSLKDIE